MRFTLERVLDPEYEPVTLAQMKDHLREFDSVTDMDSTITELIIAGREWVESFTGRALIEQTWRLTLEPNQSFSADATSTSSLVVGGFPDKRTNEHLLRRSPVLEITGVVSIDSAGAETEIAADTYALRLATSKAPKIVLLNGGTWPTDTIQITFKAGYVDDVVPKRFKQAIKLWVEANYDRDTERMKLLLDTAECLIKDERINLSLA